MFTHTSFPRSRPTKRPPALPESGHPRRPDRTRGPANAIVSIWIAPSRQGPLLDTSSTLIGSGRRIPEGDAPNYGRMPGTHLNGPIIAATGFLDAGEERTGTTGFDLAGPPRLRVP